jgi:hypothetical protein
VLFPDYPRPAVWPDGYYVPTSTGDEVIQKHACVAERERMLKGEPAREQCVVIDGVNFLNNADVDGTALPPPGAPNIMMTAGGTQLKNVLADAVIQPRSASARSGGGCCRNSPAEDLSDHGSDVLRASVLRNGLIESVVLSLG